MAHFTIDLPDNMKGEVNYGQVFRKSFNPFRKKIKMDSKTGYMIRLNSKMEEDKKYMLYKSKEGNWSIDPEGRINIEEKILIDIREAIIKKEIELNKK